jgi:hypothetical protein
MSVGEQADQLCQRAFSCLCRRAVGLSAYHRLYQTMHSEGRVVVSRIIE